MLRPRQVVRIDFYTRHGCHLCEVALQELERLGHRYRLEIELHDVDTNPEWASAYGHEVPVLLINGRKRFWGRIEPALLERCLRAEGRKA